MQNSIIRNEHLANFISTLNAIKIKIGLYTIVTGLKSDWLQFASHNTTYHELFLAPDKKSIIPTIESFLNDKWYKSWDDLAGHAQTKYWLPRPDPYLATKLLQMSRKHLGFNIQFFSGHGWWRKHLMTAKLSFVLRIRQSKVLYIYFLNALHWQGSGRCYLMTPIPHNTPGNNLCVRSLNLPFMGLFKN